jgi:NAD(P)-dependent dehydrogenase (short-subunit alcohol dehydrogenase family)
MIPATPQFAGRVAVVTGASSGIGRALALALASEGSRICAVGRNRTGLGDTVDMVRASGGCATPCEADLAVDDDSRRLVRFVETEFQNVDILAHCAGLILQDFMRDAAIQNFDVQYQVNVRAPYLLTQALLPLLKTSRGEVIFINSSVGLTTRRPELGQYAATKHALRAVAESLREEVNADGVRVLSVYLGRTATPLQEKLHRQEARPYRPELLLQPEDVAATIVHALKLPRTAEVTDISIRPMSKG